MALCHFLSVVLAALHFVRASTQGQRQTIPRCVFLTLGRNWSSLQDWEIPSSYLSFSTRWLYVLSTLFQSSQSFLQGTDDTFRVGLFFTFQFDHRSRSIADKLLIAEFLYDSL